MNKLTINSVENYRLEEVENLVKVTLFTATEAFLEWIKNETDVVDKDTKEILHNAELTLKDGHKTLLEYINPKLKEHGIVLYNETFGGKNEQQ